MAYILLREEGMRVAAQVGPAEWVATPDGRYGFVLGACGREVAVQDVRAGGVFYALAESLTRINEPAPIGARIHLTACEGA